MDLIERARFGRGQKQEEEVAPKKEDPKPRRKEAIEHTKKKEGGGTPTKKKSPAKKKKSTTKKKTKKDPYAPRKRKKSEDVPPESLEEDTKKWEGDSFTGKEKKPRKKKGNKDYEYQDRQVDEWDPEQSPEETKPYQQKERRKQTQKEYKRKVDKKNKKGKKKLAASLADFLYWGEPEPSLASGMDWSTEDSLLALDSSLPSLPGDSAEGRPCGEGEDPERGHCKDPMQTGPAGPMSDDPKTLRKMGGPPGGGGKPPTPPKGVGLDMQEDPQRNARTATHIQVMKNSDPKDPKRTSWAINKMLGGGAVKQTPKGMAGTSRPMAEKLARQQYDDAKHTMKQSGWQETSNMGNRTTWNKGGASVTMQTGPSGDIGQYTNQFVVHAPAKKKGLFGSVADLNWGPLEKVFEEGLNWIGARPCTDGDDDSEYGPRGDDQKCVDEGGGGGYYDDSPDCASPGCDLEEGHGGTHVTDESRDAVRDRNRQRSAEEGGGYGDDDPSGDDYDGGFDDENQGYEDVPEGYQELDMDNTGPEEGDWESTLDQEEPTDDDLKKTMKQEDRAAQQEKKIQDQTTKEQSRTAISIPRDPSLDPNAYHQFWDASHTGHSGVDEQRNFTLQKATQILEERVNNPRSPEDAEAARSILMNGPKAGGTYQKTKKAEPGEPSAEDFMDREDRSPIV
jgi:hypothetical protein